MLPRIIVVAAASDVKLPAAADFMRFLPKESLYNGDHLAL
jgi:hypothetical protein